MLVNKLIDQFDTKWLKIYIKIKLANLVKLTTLVGFRLWLIDEHPIISKPGFLFSQPATIPKSIIPNLGGLDLSRRGLDRDSWSWRFSKVDLDMMDNLDAFQKLVSTIKISRSRYLDLVSMSIAKTVLFGRDQDFLRLIETFVIFVDFSIFVSISIEK